MTKLFLVVLLVAVAFGDIQKAKLNRDGKQIEVKGGIDFSEAVFDEETGKRCIIKTEEVDTIEKDPILECTHKTVEQCHYTYITQFIPSQEEVCEENFQKNCQITFKQQAYNETVEKCYTPIEKVCNGEGPEECRTIYESSCTTKYVEKSPGKFVGDSKCEKLPVEICGAGCEYQEGEEECHDKVLASVVDIPEEVCDLNPQKTCRFATKLVPKLIPEHQCTLVPKETCNLRFSNPRPAKKPLLTKWCLDESEPAPGESYDESNALADPVGVASDPDVTVTFPDSAADDILPFIEDSIPAANSPVQDFYGSPGPIRPIGPNNQDDSSDYDSSDYDDSNDYDDVSNYGGNSVVAPPQEFYGAPRDGRTRGGRSGRSGRSGRRQRSRHQTLRSRQSRRNF